MKKKRTTTEKHKLAHFIFNVITTLDITHDLLKCIDDLGDVYAGKR